MNTKTAVAILLVTLFALSSMATITIRPANANPGSGSSTLTLSDAELMSASFAYEWGPGTLTGRTLIAPGVKFDLTGLQPGADTGVGNNYPVNALAGGAYKDYGYGFTGPYDFSGYKQYCLCIENVGTGPVTVGLMMNTGWTIDWSGGLWTGSDGFGASLARDTFWRSDLVSIGAGECKVVCLDFSSATCYHAMDDPVAGWQHPDGTTGVPVQRLDEVSNIGITVLGNGAGSIVVKGTQLYIDPPVISKVPGDVGTTFDVYVKLENFANLAGFDIKLTWNSAMITETSHDYTTYLNALWGAGKWSIAFETSGTGYYELVAVALATSASNPEASILFKKTFHVNRSCNFQLQTPIHFEVANLSDNTTPVPKSICTVVTDGLYTMSGTKPDLEFKVKKWNKTTHVWDPISPPYEFEYCTTFEVEVYVTDICSCSCLTDYSVVINYNPDLIHFKDVDQWGIFGTGNFVPGPDHVSVTGQGNPWSGSEGLLFTLTFHVEFAPTANHIWKYGHTNYMTFPIEIGDAELSFGNFDGTTVTLSNAELSTQFAYELGPATLAAITDIPGTGVQFDFNGLNPALGTVVGDNFPVSQLAGGAWKTYGVTNPFSTWGDFSAFKRYSLCISNVGASPVTVALKMNTGWTIPPPEYAALWRDTYWQSDWVIIEPGQCKVVTLDFSKAIVYHAGDDQEFTKYPDGTPGVAVWRLDEVSDIGIQVLGNGAGSIVVKGCPPAAIGIGGITIPTPLTIQVNFIRGDVNCDGVVNMADISSVAYYYGKTAPPEYDLNDDGVINLYDLVTIATNYGYGDP